MSLEVSLLLARPGGGSGGAEAPPLRVRAHEAALEHACCRRHGPTPGAGRRAGQTFGEDRPSIFTEHLRADPLSCDDPREGGSCDPAGAAARGAHTPRSPAAAEAYPARASFAPSATFARLTSPPCCGCGGWLVRCAWPRVAWLAPAHASIFWAGPRTRRGSSTASDCMGGLRGERRRLCAIKGGARHQPPCIDVPNSFLFCAGHRPNHPGDTRFQKWLCPPSSFRPLPTPQGVS